MSSARVTLGVTLVACGALAGVVAHRILRVRPTLRPTAISTLRPRPPEKTASRVIPAVLPDLALADAEGRPHRLAEWRGHALIVNFWATWCEPCRREIPLLIRLRHERSGAALGIVGIAVDFRAAVMKYAKNAGIDYPVLMGENQGLAAASAFGMDLVFPFSVFADARGEIVAVKVGELHRDEADFILDRVQDIDRGTKSLATAREEIAAGLKDLAIARAKHA